MNTSTAGPRRQNSLRWRANEFVAGGIATATSLTTVGGLAISLAVLIFSGDASDGLPRAVGAFAVANGVIGVLIGLRSQVVPAGTTIQDGPGIVVATLAATYVSKSNAQVVDLFVLLSLTTAITGAVLWLLGRFGLGSFVRCVPTTVIGGFIAGTGWLLFRGGLNVMVNSSLGLDDFAMLASSEVSRLWAPGLALGVLMVVVGRSGRLPASAVGTIAIVALVCFYLSVVTFSSVAAVEQDGWLIGPFPAHSRPSILSLSEVAGADWANIAVSLPGMSGVAGLSAVAVMLNITGIAARNERRIEMDDELRLVGLANLVASPLCATPGFHSISATELLHRLGAKQRGVPVATGVVLIALGVFAVEAIGYVPRFIPGALLIFLGIGLLRRWARELVAIQNWIERALSTAILVAIVWVGILPGVGAGFVAACAVFLLRYSQLDPLHSSPAAVQAGLRTPTVHDPTMHCGRTDRISTFRLQGYLFFGSSARLEREVRAAVFSEEAASVEVVIFDFAHVSGIDDSAAGLVSDLHDELTAAGISTVLSGLSTALRGPIAARIADLDNRTYASLDEALSDHEDKRIAAATSPRSAASISPQALMGLSPGLYAKFQRVRIEAGQVVTRRGVTGRGIFLVESGSLTAYRCTEQSTWQPVSRVGVLGIVGELGLVTATQPEVVVADVETYALWLTVVQYEELRRFEPVLTSELHTLFAQPRTTPLPALRNPNRGMNSTSRRPLPSHDWPT